MIKMLTKPTQVSPKRLKPALFIVSLIAMVSLPSCSWIPSFKFPGVYKISVQQGNMVNQKIVDKLQAGMTKKQVKYVMGTSLIVDTFNQNRWDYYYSKKSGSGKVDQKELSLFFVDGKLASYKGDIVPANFNTTGENINTEPTQPTGDKNSSSFWN